MNIYVDVGGSEALTLKGALLVYQGKSRSFVAWHEAISNQRVAAGPSKAAASRL
jgi:hypothetical protein